MRSGRYKLVEWFEASIGGNPDRAAFELYDLETDPFEDVDISAGNPELTREMAGRLEAWRRSVGAQPMTLNTDFDPDADQVAAPPPPGDPVSPYES